jgi:hypothetical protein
MKRTLCFTLSFLLAILPVSSFSLNVETKKRLQDDDLKIMMSEISEEILRRKIEENDYSVVYNLWHQLTNALYLMSGKKDIEYYMAQLVFLGRISFYEMEDILRMENKSIAKGPYGDSLTIEYTDKDCSKLIYDFSGSRNINMNTLVALSYVFNDNFDDVNALSKIYDNKLDLSETSVIYAVIGDRANYKYEITQTKKPRYDHIITITKK